MKQLAVLTLLLFSPSLFAVKGQKEAKSLDQDVERIMETFQIPGLGLSMVKDGRVIHAKGYGRLHLGKKDRVNADTIFGIASNTKAVTGVAVAMLVEEGLCNWDDPVVKHMPDFQMSDPYITRHMTIRDLFPHHSGLSKGAGDLLYFPESNLGQEDIYRALAHIPLTGKFRQDYAYDNILYVVAARLIQTLSGKPWAVFVQERILDPLNMKRTLTDTTGLEAAGNVVTPHAVMPDGMVPIEWSSLDNNPAAGGLNSSVNDLTHWIRMQLDRGALPDGTRLLQRDTIWETWSPVTVIPQGEKSGELKDSQSNFFGYAIGWFVTDYQGTKILLHNGGLPGQVSRVLLAPDLNFGLAILTNTESGWALNALSLALLDRELGRPQADWAGRYAKLRDANLEGAAKIEADQKAARRMDTKPSLALSEYAGSYGDSWYGEVTIAEKNGALAMALEHSPALKGTLKHWQHDTFVVEWEDRTLRADCFVTFALKPSGAVDHVTMEPVSPLTDFSYDFQDLYLTPVSGK